MGMTRDERIAKEQILDILYKQGYPTYGRLFNYFDLNLTENPEVVGYMEPGKGRITVNRYLSTDQISTIIRHEILHEYLTHKEREEAIKSSGKHKYINPYVSNIAADYEISNLGYTDKDKANARNLKLNDQTLKGLVTEDDHPDWIELTYEEMLDKLIEENPEMNSPEFTFNLAIGQMADDLEQELEDLEREAKILEEQNEDENEGNKPDDNGDGDGPLSPNDNNGDGDGPLLLKPSSIIGSDNDSEIENNLPQYDKEKESDINKKIEDLKKKISKLKDNLKDNNSKDRDDENILKTQEEINDDAESLKRMEEFKRELEELAEKSSLETESRKAMKAAMVDRQIQKARRPSSDVNKLFKDSLTNFMKRFLDQGRNRTWNRLDIKALSRGLLRPGITRYGDAAIPSINVYFDRSGSFSGHPEKTKAAEEAINLLNKYQREHRLKINLYYVSDTVGTDRVKIENEGGGANADAIIRHVKQTKPDNVIVLTDSDAETNQTVTVPGGVWILFYESKGKVPIIGKMLTREFFIRR